MPERDPKFLADVLHALGGFIYVYDLVEQRNVFVSPRWGEDFGYTLEETRAAGGTLLASIIHPDDMSRVVAHHTALRNAAEDASREIEYRVQRKGGEYAWVASADRPMERDAQGRVKTIAGHAHDITAQKDAEQARSAGEDTFRAIVESLPDAVFVADASTRIVRVNDAACQQLGYAREELLKMRIADFVAPEYTARIAERLAAPAGTATARESAHIRADGTRVPVETVVVAIELDGRPAFMGVARDIRDRLRLEAQLRDAQRMEAIGRLAGSVAHDFNNILTAILGGVSLLEHTARDARVAEVAREVAAAARRGADLTRQLLTFGRRQPTDMRALDLAEAVEHTLAVLGRLLDPSIALETDLEPGCVVLADRAMMDQVVMNLTLNARDAMGAGGTLSIRVAAAGGGRVELTVADTGAGIDPADLPRVFEPFFTTKEGGQGSGIGLATVYGIVKQHGGEISVESTPSKGTRFSVLLDRVAADVSAPPDHDLPERPRALTILLVEDMSPVRSMIAMLLESQGHRVLAVDTPAAAKLAFARQPNVDLLLTDVVLGADQDGPALAAELQRERSDLPVVLMSGFSPDPERLKLVRDGVFLQKPFNLDGLHDALAKHVLGPVASQG